MSQDIIVQDKMVQDLNNVSIELLKLFYMATQQIWQNMYKHHILPIKKIYNIDVIDIKNTPLTKYIDYAHKIKYSQLLLPDWFLLSAGTHIQKIIPCYETNIDGMAVALINMFSITGKTMIVCHISNGMMRNGMHVSDIISRNVFKAFSSAYYLMYIRLFSTSPEQCFMIKDHNISYYEHLKYGLLNKNLRRIIIVSSRQLLLLIKILKERRSDFVDDLLLMNLKRGKFVQEVLYDNKYYDMKRIFEKLWPNLDMIILAKQGNMKIHTERIRKYTGNIKLYSPVYAIPETTIGYNIHNDDAYVIDPRKAYFEFIHVNQEYMKTDIKTNITTSIRSLKIGNMYNLVISNISSGINRYVTDEIIRILGYVNGSPKIDIICSNNDLLLINNKIITPYDIERILLKKFKLVDYCYRKIDEKIDEVKLKMATLIDKLQIDNLEMESKLKLYIEIDEDCYLKDSNMIYDVKQDIKTIDIRDCLTKQLNLNAEIRILMPGTFDMLYQNRYSEYIDPSLIQIPRLIKETFDTRIIRENILFMY